MALDRADDTCHVLETEWKKYQTECTEDLYFRKLGIKEIGCGCQAKIESLHKIDKGDERFVEERCS